MRMRVLRECSEGAEKRRERRAQTRMNEQNLWGNRTNVSEEERRAARSKGGKVRAQRARERRSFKESAEMMLAGAIPLWSYEELQKYELPGIKKSSTLQDAIIARMAIIATGRDPDAKRSDIIKAAEYLRDTVGDKNPEKVEIGGEQLQLNLTVIGDDPSGGEAV